MTRNPGRGAAHAVAIRRNHAVLVQVLDVKMKVAESPAKTVPFTTLPPPEPALNPLVQMNDDA